ncbi:MAG: hypothetical protein IM671_08955 [Phenylobacterium sp.]|uniref:hypothetical protein n=2 Tax=Phenylobacterium sp. TaxID=1871053 RepID=UPI0025F68A43|nr:hypothetical protein [Phenylobacterium sp.]MCA3724095.1 hypothetical protein [Phenylobacterium sp.]MCA3729474.1 hypothetical protein [Phenylobacterium sp.]MCA6228727.1 hypothetical protein [Phenylobacterium sp.]MCA6236189.1 hypothetical protein [Phenylobacterium sp.]MCA6244245.1 hypothetical protein [Phenylobacterium sp.]
MQSQVDFLSAHPWLLVANMAGFAVWIAALCVVFQSPKFVRKWLWVLLSLFTFSIGLRTGNISGSIGVPLGAAYILWFWKFGKAPTPEQLERAAAAKRRRDVGASTASEGRVLVLRGAYLAAALATGVMGWFALSGRLEAMIVSITGADASTLLGLHAMIMMIIPLFGLLSGVLVFLSFRPYWWGKLLCAWAGLGWVGFGVIPSMVGAPNSGSEMVGVAGLVMLSAAIIHQVADPRFGGPYLRLSKA